MPKGYLTLQKLHNGHPISITHKHIAVHTIHPTLASKLAHSAYTSCLIAITSPIGNVHGPCFAHKHVAPVQTVDLTMQSVGKHSRCLPAQGRIFIAPPCTLPRALYPTCMHCLHMPACHVGPGTVCPCSGTAAFSRPPVHGSAGQEAKKETSTSWHDGF